MNASAEQKNVITVNTDQVTGTVEPTMWGVFFEDINLGADGGIYAEMVKNRSFEFRDALMGWSVIADKYVEGSLLVMKTKDRSVNPRYIRITKSSESDTLGISNEGFRGMGFKKGLRYDFAVYCRQQTPGLKMRVELVDSADNVVGSTTLLPSDATANGWHREVVSLHATETVMKGKLNIWFEGAGVFDIDMISLFPEDTWKKRPGGLRADMVQLLADMQPGFIRFPGGCIVEGHDLSLRYQWKKTVGPVEDRQLMINRWNTQMTHRQAPDYFQTFGLGFFEYFQLSEDIGAEPLPVLNCGMACQFNTAEVVPLDELEPYIQDALDLVEFANGDVTTPWGKVRAKMGHPASFDLKFMGIGNENWGPQYIERLKAFTDVMKSKYPEIKLVTSSGIYPNGELFDYLNTELRKMNADIIDEHYYRKCDWFLQNARRYDDYPRNNTKVFAGEYAAQSHQIGSIDNQNTLETALAEAAFMTGLERNADVVNLASYAPLFAHEEGWQWTPDLIWVNNLQAYGSVNYYVQKLYALNKGTNVVPALSDGRSLAGEDGLYVSAVIDTRTNDLIIKLVNVAETDRSRTIAIYGREGLASRGTATVLMSGSVEDVNSFAHPMAVIPVTTSIEVQGTALDVTLPANSFTVYRIGMK